MWGLPASGIQKTGRRTGITKQNNVDQAIQDAIAKEEWETVFTRLVQQAPPARITLLWDILMETDLNDFKQLEDKVYLYGKSLGAKDLYGRIAFTRMATILRNAQNVKI